jgi:hypothetical protein
LEQGAPYNVRGAENGDAAPGNESAVLTSKQHPRGLPMRTSRHRRQSCALCGQVFTAHYEVEVDGAQVGTRVPCFSEGCEGVIVIAHPRSAYALWLEEA